MQAIHIRKSSVKRETNKSPMVAGWWLAPALIVSVGLWAIIFALIF